MSLREFLDKYAPANLAEGSVVAITSKVVALCEGRVVPQGEISKRELVRREADFYLDPKETNGFEFFLTIKNGILIQVAGIDESNAGDNYVLWPVDLQASANEAREFLAKKFGLKKLGVIITDSKTTPLRWGVTGVGLAGSGFLALNDHRGRKDLYGRELKVSQSSVLDALAATAVFEMSEADEAQPIAIMEDFSENQVKWTGRNPSEEELKELEINTSIDIYGQILEAVTWLEGEGGRTS